MKMRISTLFSILLSNQVLQQEKAGFAPELFQIQLLLAFSLPYLDTVPVHLGAIRFSVHVLEHCLFEHIETFIIHNLLGKSYTGFSHNCCSNWVKTELLHILNPGLASLLWFRLFCGFFCKSQWTANTYFSSPKLSWLCRVLSQPLYINPFPK